jgi:hypothetical protein
MKRYLLSTQQPDGPHPPSVDMDSVVRAVAALEQEMKRAGVWVFNDHLLPPSTAKVVRVMHGGKLARATTLPIEVRPFRREAEER